MWRVEVQYWKVASEIISGVDRRALHCTKSFDTILALFPYARLHLDTSILELLLEMDNDVLRTRISPHNSLTQRFAGFSTPSHRGLSLIRDA
jgi:hypothetical protein